MKTVSSSLSFSFPGCAAVLAIIGAISLPASGIASPITLDWQPAVHSNTNPGYPTGTADVNGNAIEMTIAGGQVTASNYLRLFSATTSELPFPAADQSVKLSVSGISFEPGLTTAPKNQQLLSFTLSPSPDLVTYKSGTTGMQQGIALSITASGAFSLGWVNGDALETGWVPNINNSGRTGTATDTITGFDLILSAETYSLTIYTVGEEIKRDGTHGLSAAGWSDMGVAVMLQKSFGGDTADNRLTAHIDHLEVAVIPEPGHVALLLSGAALTWAGTRSRAMRKGDVR